MKITIERDCPHNVGYNAHCSGCSHQAFCDHKIIIQYSSIKTSSFANESSMGSAKGEKK